MERVYRTKDLVCIGTAAERAALAASSNTGVYFWETDTGVEYYSDGTSWLPDRTGGAAHVAVTGGYAGPETPGANQGVSVAYTATHGETAAITGTLVDVLCTTAAFIAIAASPVATTSGYYCAAGVTYRFPITSGNKVSAVQAAAGGTLYVHPVS